MMNRWKRMLLIKGDDPEEVIEEDEFRISNGCCFFHDQEELDEFDNIDDDAPKET
jgi:hypothetical protein